MPVDALRTVREDKSTAAGRVVETQDAGGPLWRGKFDLSTGSLRVALRS